MIFLGAPGRIPGTLVVHADNLLPKILFQKKILPPQGRAPGWLPLLPPRPLGATEARCTRSIDN